MNDTTLIILGILSGTTTTVSLAIAYAMIVSGGIADFNYYGEGWFEVVLTGVIAAAGWIELRKQKREMRA